MEQEHRDKISLLQALSSYVDLGLVATLFSFERPRPRLRRGSLSLVAYGQSTGNVICLLADTVYVPGLCTLKTAQR
ncbi:MAG TPA: hypothetical protein DCW86_01190 [Actinobacteria bacterium]|nr:hypothetical protein [Actinomycetota bacterium]